MLLFLQLVPIQKNYGAIAQLVERMDGIHEVTGSTPVSSTILRLSTPSLLRPGGYGGQAGLASYRWHGQPEFILLVHHSLGEGGSIVEGAGRLLASQLI